MRIMTKQEWKAFFFGMFVLLILELYTLPIFLN